MNVTEMLQIADRLVFAETGKHLDNLQEAVIKGVWQGQSYQVIADESQHSESRVRAVGQELWKILSAQLGEDVNKCNFYCTFKRLELNSSELNIHTTIQNNLNLYKFCAYPHQSSNNEQNGKNVQKIPYYNLKQAPKIGSCYGRDNELLSLSQWVENPKTQLISVLGIGGIGKSTLVRQFVESNTQPFDLIIWKNIKLYNSLYSLLADILTEIKAENNESNKFLDLLQQKRCLIILDNLEEIFLPQEFSGKYKPEYKEHFFRDITQTEHQSCLILLSREKCQNMISLNDEVYPSYCLELSGLGNSASQLLKKHCLKDENSWSTLIDLYEGNPSYLQNIIGLIQELFDGNVADFLEEKVVILTEDIKSMLNELSQRLSSVEQQILSELAQYDIPLSRKEIQPNLSLSSMELINGLQSLNRRYLIKTITEKDIKFSLSPVFREYVISYPAD